jgi:hypothetical protein
MKSIINLLVLMLVSIGYSQFQHPHLIMPEELNIYLCSKKIQDVFQPALAFSCITGPNTAYWSSSLYIDTFYEEDKILIKILGYDFMDNSEFYEKNGLFVGGMTQESRKSVYISRYLLRDLEKKKLIVLLNDRVNEFEIIRQSLVVSLIPKTIININIDSSRVDNPLQVILFPPDVFRLSLSGDVDDKIDYMSDIFQFIRKFDIIPAYERYPQIPKLGKLIFYVYIAEDNQLYTELRLNNFKSLGNLPGYENVKVNIYAPSSYCY